MNVQKISKFIFIAAFVFGLSFGGRYAFAYTNLEYSVDGSGNLSATIPFLQSSCDNATPYRAALLGYHEAYPTTDQGSNGSSFGGSTHLDTLASAFSGLLWASTTPSGTTWNVNLYNNSLYIFGGVIADGNYWIGIACYPSYGYYYSDTGDVSNMYIISGLHLTGGVWQGSFVNDTSSRIDTFSYSTTTAKATITGFWNATTTPYITERLTFWQYSDTLGKESYEQLVATTTGAFSWTFDFKDPYAWTTSESSTTPIYTSFTLNALLDQYDETNYDFPFGGTVIDNLDATSTTLYAASYNASDFTSTPRDLALYPEYECGITSMMGCIKNALIWTFYPTQDALDSWTALKTTLETKAPIGYFYSVKNAVGGLSATSTPSFSLTIPAHLKQYIFDPFDIGIAGILWFFFIFHFYKRLKTIQI